MFSITMTKRQPNRIRRKVVFVLAAVIAVGAWYVLRSPGTVDFRLHRAQYERIAARAKTLPTGPKGYSHYWINSPMGAEPIGSRNRSGDMSGQVFVERSDTGKFNVSIITQDMGHLGTFGYVYADAPGNSRGTRDLPSLQRRLDAHWWIAYNDMW